MEHPQREKTLARMLDQVVAWSGALKTTEGARKAGREEDQGEIGRLGLSQTAYGLVARKLVLPVRASKRTSRRNESSPSRESSGPGGAKGWPASMARTASSS